MNHQDLSPALRRVLDAGLVQCKAFGRAVLTREVAEVYGGAPSTVHRHIQTLILVGVAKKSERGPGYLFRRPVPETSARLMAVCKRHGLSEQVTTEIIRAGGEW